MTRMDCDEVRDLIQAYDDGELPASELASVEEHLKTCPDCARRLADLRSLRGRIRTAGTLVAPVDLAPRIRAAIELANDGAQRPRWRRIATLTLSHAAVGLLCAVISIWALMRIGEKDTISREMVAAHIRALMVQPLVQVASADTHTVRPWFAGKVPFSPPVADLAALGFPLIGGRVDHVLDQTAASLVYDRRQHRISVFILPEDQVHGAREFRGTRNGYNIVAWTESGFFHVAVSDLNVSELRSFVVAQQRPTLSQ